MTVYWKGLAFRSWLNSFRILYGDDCAAKLHQYLPSELRDMVDRNLLLASGWYPRSLYAGMLEAGRRAGPAGERVAFAVSYHATCADINGVYRFMMGVIGPSILTSNAHRVVAMYLRGGKGEYHQTGPNSGNVTLHDLAETRLGWQDLLGGVQALMDVGCPKHDVRVRIESGGGDSDSVTTMSVHFRNK